MHDKLKAYACFLYSVKSRADKSTNIFRGRPEESTFAEVPEIVDVDSVTAAEQQKSRPNIVDL
jgi:hypothetical protein